MLRIYVAVLVSNLIVSEQVSEHARHTPVNNAILSTHFVLHSFVCPLRHTYVTKHQPMEIKLTIQFQLYNFKNLHKLVYEP